MKSARTKFIGNIEINLFGVKQIFFYDPDNKMLEINKEFSESTTASN